MAKATRKPFRLTYSYDNGQRPVYKEEYYIHELSARNKIEALKKEWGTRIEIHLFLESEIEV